MTKVIGHRGYAALYPENTMLSFKKAYEHGADGIELDIHMSVDKEIIVIHDPSLNRTTNQKGRVNQLTLDKIKNARIKNGLFKITDEQVPTLKEVMDWIITTDMTLNIEIKGVTEGVLEDGLLKLLSHYDMKERIIISSFNLESLLYIEKIDSSYETALLTDKDLGEPWIYLESHGIKSVHPYGKSYMTDAKRQEVVRYNLPARVYTVNRAKEIQYWLEEEIDAIITDEVEVAVKLKKDYLLKQH
ncbi:glycerophosphodiester phosphodiesterase [Macrococcoides bohemicum]|uniref:Glycerophosphodiester phosphodiesterase n=1 Tax=Macrococcoides bohemicum TaxID=1903056 RepID=A0AAE7Q667_9STAP|nr:glycerophosphodiester phosphodiesterase family protein [Macrococcus bohemicus]QRN50049.1 glycerophosphodiester phosphodiesterase [Macrococcus bohemicus]QYA41487.1 glycerophosphodiester phosphodiesterase [Macrococcus bohemicus]QYA43912.1 glycerophosphodiester phosphodiesterase [Macrococcus bohemicus]